MRGSALSPSPVRSPVGTPCSGRRASRFIATGLELGGKDPAYVRPDAQFDATVENLVDGAMFNSGQSCCAVERIYVHRDLYTRFVEACVALTRQYRLGNPLDPATTLGPLVRTEAAEKVRQADRRRRRAGRADSDRSGRVFRAIVPARPTLRRRSWSMSITRWRL
jgi:acyl-CoA reductase-like NAD-dependent aldehyde dehydrogenase